MSDAPSRSFRDNLVKEIPNLRAFAASLSGSMQTADDLVQDTLLKAWGHSAKFTEGTNLRAWLFTILRNTYYSMYRRRGREVQDTDGIYSSKVAVQGN
jgi:RNA polymerase sigma-70 factor (ECF subfamily)